ncbi:hypothetical protein CAAN1_19S02278 [[Candida] anglica]|uniref:Uncharacterized protein n=1 Tax=[Candida] anglica TaxID=148631 RepID=A0ABP0E7B3_9ASCO
MYVYVIPVTKRRTVKPVTFLIFAPFTFTLLVYHMKILVFQMFPIINPQIEISNSNSL